jgi:hypothetical protein
LEDAIQRNQADAVPALASALIAARESSEKVMSEYREHASSAHSSDTWTMTAGGDCND